MRSPSSSSPVFWPVAVARPLLVEVEVVAAVADDDDEGDDDGGGDGLADEDEAGRAVGDGDEPPLPWRASSLSTSVHLLSSSICIGSVSTSP